MFSNASRSGEAAAPGCAFGMTGNPASVILMYHSIDDSGSVISVSPQEFARQMDWLAASGVPVVPFPEAVRRPGAVALTFDDGFRNLLSNGLPQLEKHGFRATLFVVSGRAGLDNGWPGQGRGIPRLPLLDWSEVRELAQHGMALGAHSQTHPDLRRLPLPQAIDEMRRCRDEIADRVGAPVEAVAYPYGLSTPAVRQAASQLFRYACGTRLRHVLPGDDLFDLPRVDVYYLRSAKRFESLLTRAGRRYLRWRAAARRVRQWISH